MAQDPTHVNLTILTSEPSVKSGRSFDIKVEGPKTRDGQKLGKRFISLCRKIESKNRLKPKN